MSKFAFALRALPLLGVLVAPAAHAQAPAPFGAPPPASSASVYGPAERPALARPTHPQQVTANISSGATFNGGNTKSFAATLGGRFQLIKHPNQLTLEAMGSFASARAADDNKLHTTSKNVVGRVRYDIFLSDNNALFAALAPRSDRFAGLDLRLQTQGGYLRNLYRPIDNHRLWLELGYDGTYDNFTPWKPHGAPRPAMKVNIPKYDFVHSGRAFLGYTNLLTPLATLNFGVELLYDFEHPDNVRVNSTAEITSSISARFKLGLLSRVLYDNVPVEGKKKTDYITAAQLVFTYDSITPPPACPACDCSEQVAAAKSSCKQASSLGSHEQSVGPAPVAADAPPGAYTPEQEPSVPTAGQPQPAAAQPAPAKPVP